MSFALELKPSLSRSITKPGLYYQYGEALASSRMYFMVWRGRLRFGQWCRQQTLKERMPMQSATQEAPPLPQVHAGRDPEAERQEVPASEQSVGLAVDPRGAQAKASSVSSETPSTLAADDVEPTPELSSSSAEPDPANKSDATEHLTGHDDLERCQRRRKSVLSDCARLRLFDFHVLAMADWPENFALAQARRLRDHWLLAMTLLAVTFLAGLGNLVPAWAGGVSFGGFTLLGFLSLPALRCLITTRPSYRELLLERRQSLRAARQHIAQLESRQGLAWQCQTLAELNPALRQARFQKLYSFSRNGNLLDHIRTRAHVRHYLMFLLEAERAYGAMEQLFVDTQREGLQVDEPADKPSEVPT